MKITIATFAMLATVANAGLFPLQNAYLVTNLNANGQSITNAATVSLDKIEIPPESFAGGTNRFVILRNDEVLEIVRYNDYEGSVTTCRWEFSTTDGETADISISGQISAQNATFSGTLQVDEISGGATTNFLEKTGDAMSGALTMGTNTIGFIQGANPYTIKASANNFVFDGATAYNFKALRATLDAASLIITNPPTSEAAADDYELYRYTAGNATLMGWRPPGGGGGGASTIPTLEGSHTWTGTNTYTNSVVFAGAFAAGNGTWAGTITAATISNMTIISTPFAKIHRIESNVFALAETWENISWELTVDSETSWGISTSAADTITFDFSGHVNIDGCLRPEWTGADNTPAWIASRVIWTTNDWTTTNEARCLQAYYGRQRLQGELDTASYKGSLAVTTNTQIRLQAQVSSTDMILQGQPVFDNPTAASINIYCIGKPAD